MIMTDGGVYTPNYSLGIEERKAIKPFLNFLISNGFKRKDDAYVLGKYGIKRSRDLIILYKDEGVRENAFNDGFISVSFSCIHQLAGYELKSTDTLEKTFSLLIEDVKREMVEELRKIKIKKLL